MLVRKTLVLAGTTTIRAGKVFVLAGTTTMPAGKALVLAVRPGTPR